MSKLPSPGKKTINENAGGRRALRQVDEFMEEVVKALFEEGEGGDELTTSKLLGIRGRQIIREDFNMGVVV